VRSGIGVLPLPRAQGDLVVETLSDERALAGLEPVWNRLVEEAGLDHPFVTYEWVRTWWECFGGGRRLHVLVVREGDEPIAIAPLMINETRFGGWRVRRLEFMANVHTQRSDFIMTRRREEAYRAIWSLLLEQRDLWDVLVLCQVSEASRTFRELPRLASESGCLTGLWHSNDAPYASLLGRWDDYQGGLPAKHRANLRNRFKRLGRLGDVTLEVVREGEGLPAALAEGFRIEAAGWKGQAGTAIADDPRVLRFYEILAGRAARRGWLRLHFLRAGGHRVAFDYSLHYGNRAFLLKPAYDPKYAAYSPSNLLCYLVLRDGFEGGLAEFDFLGAEDPWKLAWATSARRHFWLYVFPSTLQMRLVRWAKFGLAPRLRRHRAYALLRDAARAVTDGLKSRRPGPEQLGCAKRRPA